MGLFFDIDYKSSEHSAKNDFNNIELSCLSSDIKNISFNMASNLFMIRTIQFVMTKFIVKKENLGEMNKGEINKFYNFLEDFRKKYKKLYKYVGNITYEDWKIKRESYMSLFNSLISEMESLINDDKSYEIFFRKKLSSLIDKDIKFVKDKCSHVQVDVNNWGFEKQIELLKFKREFYDWSNELNDKDLLGALMFLIDCKKKNPNYFNDFIDTGVKSYILERSFLYYTFTPVDFNEKDVEYKYKGVVFEKISDENWKEISNYFENESKNYRIFNLLKLMYLNDKGLENLENKFKMLNGNGIDVLEIAKQSSRSIYLKTITKDENVKISKKNKI